MPDCTTAGRDRWEYRPNSGTGQRDRYTGTLGRSRLATPLLGLLVRPPKVRTNALTCDAHHGQQLICICICIYAHAYMCVYAHPTPLARAARARSSRRQFVIAALRAAPKAGGWHTSSSTASGEDTACVYSVTHAPASDSDSDSAAASVGSLRRRLAAVMRAWCGGHHAGQRQQRTHQQKSASSEEHRLVWTAIPASSDA